MTPTKKIYDTVKVPMKETIVRSILVLTLILCWQIDVSLAGVTVYPPKLTLDENTSTGRFIVSNKGPDTKLIDINMIMGYPVSDDEGNISFRFSDSLPQSGSPMKSWTNAYPKHFTLTPGESQAVAVFADPPAGLDDGEYWVRLNLRIRSTVSDASANNSVTQSPGTKNGIYQHLLGVYYRHGSVRTGVSVRNLTTEYRGDIFRITVSLQREGNAVFRGNILCALTDTSENRIIHYQREIAVYSAMNYSFNIPKTGVKDGPYSCKIEINTERTGDILPSATVRKEIKLHVKGGKYYYDPIGPYTASSAVWNNVPDDVPLPGIKEPGEMDNSTEPAGTHSTARALEPRLKELLREQDHILKELRKLAAVMQ